MSTNSMTPHTINLQAVLTRTNEDDKLRLLFACDVLLDVEKHASDEPNQAVIKIKPFGDIPATHRRYVLEAPDDVIEEIAELARVHDMFHVHMGLSDSTPIGHYRVVQLQFGDDIYSLRGVDAPKRY